MLIISNLPEKGTGLVIEPPDVCFTAHIPKPKGAAE